MPEETEEELAEDSPKPLTKWQRVKNQFKFSSGFVWKAYKVIWGIYLLALAGLDFYSGTILHEPLYFDVAIWKLFAVLIWFLYFAVIADSRMYRQMWHDSFELIGHLIEGRIELRRQITELKAERDELLKTQKPAKPLPAKKKK